MTSLSQTAKFITMEGVEGVGKTTNLAFVHAYLQQAGIPVHVTREPGGTDLAEEIRGLLLSNRSEKVDPTAELLLVFAARAQHFNTVIEQKLREGVWVLCDRFIDATYAYQGFGRGLPIDTIQSLEALVLQGRQPDLTLYLDLPVEIGLARAKNRGDSDRFEREAVAFFERVREGYLSRVATQPERFAVVDASPELSLVQIQIAEALASLVAQ